MPPRLVPDRGAHRRGRPAAARAPDLGRATHRARVRRGQLLVELLVALAILTLAGSALARQLVVTHQLDDRRHAVAVATTIARDASEQLAGDACHPDETPRTSGRVHLARTTSVGAGVPRQSLVATLPPSALGSASARTLTSAAAGWCP